MKPWERDWSNPEKTLDEATKEQKAEPIVADAKQSEPEGMFDLFQRWDDNPIYNWLSGKTQKSNEFIERSELGAAQAYGNLKKQLGILTPMEGVESKYASSEKGLREARYNESMNKAARANQSPALTAAGGEVSRIGDFVTMQLMRPFESDEETDARKHELKFTGEQLARLRNYYPTETTAGSILPYLAIPELRFTKGLSKVPGFNKMRFSDANKMKMLQPTYRSKMAEKMRKFAESNKPVLPLNIPGMPKETHSSIAKGTEAILRKGANVRADLIDAGTRVGVQIPELIKNSRAIDNTLTAGTIGAIHPDDTILGGSSMGAAGYYGGKIAGHYLGKPTYDLTENAVQNNKWLERNKFFIPPSLRTGTRFNEMIDSAMETNAHTGNIMQGKYMANQRKINNIAARVIGDEDALAAPAYQKLGDEVVPDLSADFIERQYSRIGRDLDIAEDRITGQFGRNDLDKLNRIVGYYTSNIDEKLHPTLKAQSHKIESAIKNAINNEGYTTPGQFLRLSKNLRKVIKAKKRAGDDVVDHLYKLENLLDDAAKRGSSKAELKNYNTAKQQYARLKLIEDSVDAKGNIDPSKLYNKMNNKYYKRMLRTDAVDSGMQDLVEIARYGNRLKSRKGASLSASQEIGNLFTNPGQALFKGANILSSHAPIGTASEILLALYNMGYPHTTGYIPGLSKEFMARIGSRSTFGTGNEPEDRELK